jgi:hypothetical protein
MSFQKNPSLSAVYCRFYSFFVKNTVPLLCFWGAFVTGCQPETPTGSVKLLRFEKDLFAIDTNHITEDVRRLAQKYPVFLPFFLQQVILMPGDTAFSPESALREFITAPPVKRLYDSCQLRFADLKWLEPRIGRLFWQYKQYFPEKPTPTVVTAVTEFIGDAHMINDTLLMLGLDFFMGPQFPGYDPNIFPAYFTRKFDKPYMEIQLARAMANYVGTPPESERILDMMIYNGKLLHTMDCLLPKQPDHMIMGYTPEEWDGCVANEQNLWTRLLDLKVLFEPVTPKNQKIVMPGPATDNVFTEAPGEVGNWIGWQIVRAYMKRYPDTSLPDLFAQRDARQFLEQSKYKPERR